jgi:hypothetical protein
LFLPVELTPGAAAGVQIELPGGAVVRLPRDASPELIAAAVGAAWQTGQTGETSSC